VYSPSRTGPWSTNSHLTNNIHYTAKVWNQDVHCYFLPRTISHVHNSFNTNYSLYLTCNDLPFRQVQSWMPTKALCSVTQFMLQSYCMVCGRLTDSVFSTACSWRAKFLAACISTCNASVRKNGKQYAVQCGINSNEHNQACHIYLVYAGQYVHSHIKKFCKKYPHLGTVIFHPENI